MFKKITDLKLKNQTIILRTDYNVPVINHKVEKYSSWRLKATFETLKYLEKQDAKIIILCHLGRPEGKVVKELRLKPIAEYLAKSLKRKLILFDDKAVFFPKELAVLTQKLYFIPKNSKGLPEKMTKGDILILENIRFHPGEQAPSHGFAKILASLGDVFVNEAFATAHRNEASIALLPKYLPAAAGFLMQKEIKTLNKIKRKTPRPLVFVMGGAKAKTKTELILSFLPKVEEILVGGVLANTILAAKGIAIGKSIVDQETAKTLNQLEITNTKLHLPVDVIASPTQDGKSPIVIRPVGNVGKENMILDIGPDTILLFRAIIEKAKTIIWNGPMGYSEVKKFSQGTEAILEAIIKNKKAYTVVGGGESIALVAKHRLLKKINFVSTGGGALLKFLAGEYLPGIEVLKK